MSNFKKLTDNLYVSEQLNLEDISQISAMGIKRIICNRPNGEAADQTNFEDIAQLADENGIETLFLPIANPQSITPEIIAQFKDEISQEGTSLAYCRTGTRSTWIWAFGAIEDTPISQVVQIGANAQYDLSALTNLS